MCESACSPWRSHRSPVPPPASPPAPPQEEYVKDEMKNLKREIIRAKEVRAVVPQPR